MAYELEEEDFLPLYLLLLFELPKIIQSVTEKPFKGLTSPKTAEATLLSETILIQYFNNFN